MSSSEKRWPGSRSDEPLGQPRLQHRPHERLRLLVVGVALDLHVDLVHAPGLVDGPVDVLRERAVLLAEGQRVHGLGDLLGGALEHAPVCHHSDPHLQSSLCRFALVQSPLGMRVRPRACSGESR